MDWMNQAAISAQKSDAVFFYVFGLSVAFLLFITILMIYFVIRYSKKRNPVASQIEGHVGLEILWTTIPLVLFLSIFYYGWTNYEYMRQAPRDAMAIKVTARQWSWSFAYPNGKQTKVLFAPIGKPMKVDVVSADMIHGFFVPSFRLKIDAVPARNIPATNFLLVSNDVKKACESTKTSYSSAAGIDCGDPAHDFQGTTDTPWCIVADSPEDPNLTSNCSATALSGSCVADGMAPMSKYTTGHAAGRYVRSIALCGMSGQFVGWMCTTT